MELGEQYRRVSEDVQKQTEFKITSSSSPPSWTISSSRQSSPKDSSTQKIRSPRDLYKVRDEFHLVCFLGYSEPLQYEYVMKDKRWKDAINEELNFIERNKTWKLTSLPQGQNAISVKWVYKINKNAEAQVKKYKTRLVTKDYKQKFGINYD